MGNILAAYGLKLRLLLIVTISTLFLASISLAGVYLIASHNALTEAERQVNQILDAVEYSGAISAYTGDQQIAHRVLKGILRSDFVCDATIEGTGKIHLSQQKRTDKENCSNVVRRELHSPFEDTEVIGHIETALYGPEINSRANHIARMLAISLTLMEFATAAVLWFTISHFLTRPLLLLSAKMHSIIPGTSHRLDISFSNDKDEITRLTMDINHLLKIVEQTLNDERGLRSLIEAMERQYQSIFEEAQTGIMLIDGTEHCLLANPAVSVMLGLTACDGPFCPFGDWIGSVFVDPDEIRFMLSSALKTAESYAKDVPVKFITGRRGSGWLHVLISPHKSQGANPLVECLLFDISERKNKEDNTRYIAEHDVLTNLYNRRAGVAILSKEVERCNSTGERGGVILLLDLDRFKQVNDTLGHESGDKVLVEVAKRMQGVVRTEDVVARLGGDEFMIGIFEFHSERALKELLTRLVREIGQVIDLGEGRATHVGCSIGAVRYPEPGKTLAELINIADIGLYGVKNAGRNGFSVFDGKDYEATILRA